MSMAMLSFGNSFKGQLNHNDDPLSAWLAIYHNFFLALDFLFLYLKISCSYNIIEGYGVLDLNFLHTVQVYRMLDLSALFLNTKSALNEFCNFFDVSILLVKCICFLYQKEFGHNTCISLRLTSSSVQPC